MLHKKTLLIGCAVVLAVLLRGSNAVAQQEEDVRYTFDAAGRTIPLPDIFKPGMDLSGRGLHPDITWPQTVAAREVLDVWGNEIGFKGIYRLQYNLWEISQLYKAKDLQKKLIENYESVIKRISDSGGIVILNIFGTPAGLGRVLDKKSVPEDLSAFKSLIKTIIRELSCKKRYSVWYEFWNAPDLDDFFLGRKQEYFNLYREIAETVKELENETTINIPLGGPAISWWFQNLGGNTIVTPERSLIYELIKYCYRYRLPLDFITWHAYSTDAQAEKELTVYRKPAVALIREWLTYFNFNRTTPLFVDEWNYDRNANVLPERKENSFIGASYIPARIMHMYSAGIDRQLFFCLEDFQNNKEGVVRNVGVFYAESDGQSYKGGSKAAYNVLRMIGSLGKEMFVVKNNVYADDFTGIIPTKQGERIAVLLYNYIDPDIALNYVSKNIATVTGTERKLLMRSIESGQLEKVLLGQQDIATLRATKKMKAVIKKAQELHEKAKKRQFAPQPVRLTLKSLQGSYDYQRFVVDSSCSFNCPYMPVEEKSITAAQDYEETISLNPYSVHLIVLTPRRVVPQQEAIEPQASPVSPESLPSPAAPQPPSDQPIGLGAALERDEMQQTGVGVQQEFTQQAVQESPDFPVDEGKQSVTQSDAEKQN
jgi:hypothetical protein